MRSFHFDKDDDSSNSNAAVYYAISNKWTVNSNTDNNQYNKKETPNNFLLTHDWSSEKEEER